MISLHLGKGQMKHFVMLGNASKYVEKMPKSWFLRYCPIEHFPQWSEG